MKSLANIIAQFVHKQFVDIDFASEIVDVFFFGSFDDSAERRISRVCEVNLWKFFE